MKWHGSVPKHSSMCPWPRGKYQTSPGSKSLVSAKPSGSITVVRTRPLSTKAHSAAVACQCSSRMAPGSSFIDTPAMPLEIGNCSTVASLPKLLPMTLPSDFSRANLNVGSSCPDKSGSGTLLEKLVSPAVAVDVATSPAAEAAKVAPRDWRRSTELIGAFLQRDRRLRDQKPAIADCVHVRPISDNRACLPPGPGPKIAAPPRRPPRRAFPERSARCPKTAQGLWECRV